MAKKTTPKATVVAYAIADERGRPMIAGDTGRVYIYRTEAQAQDKIKEDADERVVQISIQFSKPKKK